jgi:hypothetical protein
MTAERYINTLQHHLLPSIQRLFPQRRAQFTFMQDNAPSHSAHLTKNWLLAHRIEYYAGAPLLPHSPCGQLC